jgi:hypothetical protein
LGDGVVDSGVGVEPGVAEGVTLGARDGVALWVGVKVIVGRGVIVAGEVGVAVTVGVGV